MPVDKLTPAGREVLEATFCLSTGHLPDGDVMNDPLCPWSNMAYEHGWIAPVYAHTDTSDWPHQFAALIPVFEWARANGADYVRFDADGNIVEALPVFNW